MPSPWHSPARHAARSVPLQAGATSARARDASAAKSCGATIRSARHPTRPSAHRHQACRAADTSPSGPTTALGAAARSRCHAARRAASCCRKATAAPRHVVCHCRGRRHHAHPRHARSTRWCTSRAPASRWSTATAPPTASCSVEELEDLKDRHLGRFTLLQRAVPQRGEQHAAVGGPHHRRQDQERSPRSCSSPRTPRTCSCVGPAR